MRAKILISAIVCLLLAFPCRMSSLTQTTSQLIEGLVPMNFPIMDGSDSTTPLRSILMCKLLGYEYEWSGSPFLQQPDKFMGVGCHITGTEEEKMHLYQVCMQENNTHQSFLNLLDGKVELIITARGISRDETVYAEEQGVTLIEKPIAKDALAFIVNKENPANRLTTKQIQDIYTEKLTNWKDAGGNDAPIAPFIRNANSGSQEKFETMVMKGLEIADLPEYRIGKTMASPYHYIEMEENGIAFTPYYYFKYIARVNGMKVIAVDGVEMTKENIANGSYPYISDVVAAVRADIDRESMAYKVFEFLTTPAGQDIVSESGYVSLNDQTTAIGAPEAQPGRITLNGNRIIVEADSAPVRIEATDMSGKSLLSSPMTTNEIRLPRTAQGIIAVRVTLADGSAMTDKVLAE